MTRTVVVDARGAGRTVECLDMKCDGKEIPEFLSDLRPIGWWMSGQATFAGTVTPGGESGQLGEPKTATMSGTAAISVGAGRIIGILSPYSQTAAAIWWSWPPSEFTIESRGSQGMLKKRPASIALHLNGGVERDGGSIVLKNIDQLYRNSNRIQGGQEASFLAAIGGLEGQ